MDRETAASERGLHYVVVAAADKRPLAKGWLRCAAPDEEVEAARADPERLIGHVPCAAGLLVVDIDTGKKRPVRYWREAVRDHLGAPLFEVRTRSGGLHLYYRCDQPVGNRNWEGGEIRCAKGYAVLWDEEAVLAALEQIDQVDAVDVSQWPIRHKTGKRRRAAKGRRGQTARVRAALRCIPCSEVSYDEWVMGGMALHWAEAHGCVGDGLGLWRDWSATDPDRYKVGECAAKWRGFDAEGGLTLGSLFWLAKRYGWKGCRRRGRRTGEKREQGHPLLNARQVAILDMLTALATPGKSGRLTITVLQQVLADHFGCCRETIVRDFKHLKACGYVRIVGQRIIREADGGFVVPVYRPTDPDMERWLQHVRAKRAPAKRVAIVHMGGGVCDIFAPIPGVGSGLPVLRRRFGAEMTSRAPP
ncbi:MAG: PriCT-2 domain-containing protein [Caldilineaceae bacterium]|nr:PriCT-2 domain-containing protein [Caldilineaceae bacterium]